MKANRFLPYNFLRERSTNVNFPDVDLVQFIQEVIDDGDLNLNITGITSSSDITINASSTDLILNANATMTVTAVTYDLDAVDVEITATNDVTVDVTGVLSIVGLPTYADNAAALADGLVATNLYRTATGVLMIVY